MDLDNTLIDRDAAFGDAVAGFLDERGLPAGDLPWVMAADGGGFTSRAAVAAAMNARFPHVSSTAIRGLLDTGAANRVVLAPQVADELRRLTGWTTVIVTNGRTAQQRAKIVNTGLDRLVDGWVISEQAGHRKPEPEIFRAAAATVGASLDGAWMIGDSAHADIAGAAGLGLTSIWVANGRRWTESGYQPAHVAEDIVTALRLVPTS
ncbi:putative hydrolase of the HAD superfamily [Actinoplanes derwentensis]|uniref:Putative hydrolase of the HAD superfamily n=2 Tax=Actinoplanes derwentensis TaxID=113562 RepID=A0A1H1Q5A9_9ACTN|nr:putative hydrolase of the HAD superfamily [Actinoplanes derwentensis]